MIILQALNMFSYLKWRLQTPFRLFFLGLISYVGKEVHLLSQKNKNTREVNCKFEVTYQEIEPQITKRLQSIKVDKNTYETYVKYVTELFDLA